VLILAAIGFSAPASAQPCPSPVVVTGTPCTVAPGTTVTVTSGAVPGLRATGTGGDITADGITVNLGPGGAVGDRNYVGASAASAGTISLDGSTIKTVQVAGGQRGIVSSGNGSLVEGTGATITIGLGATAASDLVAVLAQAGGAVELVNGTVSTLGGANSIGNHGLWATGAGSEISFSGGSVTTVARGSFGTFAEGGASIVLSNGASISTTGLEVTATGVGSHAVFASGSGSTVTGTGITLSTAGSTANGARAENGGSVALVSSQVSSTSSAAAGKGASALSATSGGSVSLTGAGGTISATGTRGHGLSVQDAGSIGVLSGVNMTVSGTLANGVFVDAGGASVTDTVMTVRGSIGVVVQNSGTLAMTGGAIQATAATAAGLSATSGAVVTLNGTAVTTGWDPAVVNGGINASALLASGGAAISGTDLTVVTRGEGRAYGALAGVDGTITLVGGTVDTYGDATDPSTSNARRPEGLVAQGSNALLNATGTTVHTRGLEGFAVVADDGGTVNLDEVSIRTDGTLGIGLYAVTDQAIVNANTITMTGGSIETFGGLGHGALASQSNLAPLATVNLSGTAILTHGGGATGLRALGMGTVNAEAGTVETLGADAHGLYARDNGSSINLDAMTITTSGASAHGGVAARGGLLTGAGTVIAAGGTNAAGLYIVGEPGFVSAARFSASEIRNLDGPTIGMAGSGNVELTNSFAGGSGQWLLVGTVADFPALLAPEPLHAHRTDDEIGADPPTAQPGPSPISSSPGLANVALSGSRVSGSAVTRAGSVSNVTMVDASLWDLTGNSNLTTLLNDLSLIDFSAPTGDPQSPASYKTLTVEDYAGAAGVIVLNTYLDTDGSPSDLLVIDGGTATGDTGLSIRNYLGGGALTAGNGILVVDAIAGATTAVDAFHLAAPALAGAYEYSLYRSSLDESGPENWYLRSEYAPTPDPDPHYRQEVSLIAAIPPLAALYGRHMIDTFHERQGERLPVAGELEAGTDDIAWSRIIGIGGRHGGNPLGIYQGSEPSFDYGMGAVQFGLDLYRRQDDAAGTNDTAGVYAGLGSAVGEVEHALPDTVIDAGTTSLDALTLGGYWTHYGDVGQYLDAVMQATFYNFTTASERITAAHTQGIGYAASLEGGYPLSLGEGWIIEPQAQAVLQLFDISGFNDGFADISYSDTASLVGRLGVRVAHDFSLREDNDLTAWGRLNLFHEFLGTPTTTFSSADGPLPFTADLRDTWLQLAIGGDYDLNETSSAFAQVSYDTTFDGASHAFEAKLGLKGRW